MMMRGIDGQKLGCNVFKCVKYIEDKKSIFSVQCYKDDIVKTVQII